MTKRRERLAREALAKDTIVKHDVLETAAEYDEGMAPPMAPVLDSISSSVSSLLGKLDDNIKNYVPLLTLADRYGVDVLGMDYPEQRRHRCFVAWTILSNEDT